MTKPDDEIVEEIRRRREAHAESMDFDLERIVAALRREELASGDAVVSRPPRPPTAVPKRSA